MTHEYTILFGGTILVARDPDPARDRPEPPVHAAGLTAIAWADDTILAVGTDEAVRSMSRGDSRFVDLRGARIVPLRGTLDPGAPADFDILAADPTPETQRVVAVVRGGRVVDGALPRARSDR